jgi:hypothetical protein
MLGRPARDRRHSLAQLTAVLQPTNDPRHIVQAQVFSYRSLLTFKLMKEVPLPYRESLRALRLLIPSFAVVGIHHVDRPASGKFCVVERGREGRPDRLGISYRSEESEARSIREHERRLLRVFRGFGCWPLKTIRPGHGSSLHYAGTFPMLPQGSELTCDRDGRLRATQNVYVVDGSVFPWIPPKGLTFTLMANANRVGTLLAERLA